MLRRVCACGSALNFLSTPEYRAQAPRGLADPTPTTQNPRVNRRLRPSTMLCFRCRAVPSLRTSVSSMQTPINRVNPLTQNAPRIQSNLSSRPFSSLLSTPTRFQPSQTFSRLPTSTPTPIASAASSLLQQPQQTRSFSATASLGVRRVTFRPSRRVQKRRHGFLSRNKARKGRQTLTRRRLKGRRDLSW